jgi:hypothetical protein
MTTIDRWRAGLIAFGVVLLVIAAVTLVNDVPPSRYLGLGVWLVGALVLHDGVVAMAIVAVSVIVRKIDRRVPFVAVLMVQGAVVVGAIVTVIVLPEVIKKSIGTANPSILPLDYLANLGLFFLGLTVVTGTLVAVYLLVARGRRIRRAPSRTD